MLRRERVSSRPGGLLIRARVSWADAAAVAAGAAVRLVRSAIFIQPPRCHLATSFSSIYLSPSPNIHRCLPNCLTTRLATLLLLASLTPHSSPRDFFVLPPLTPPPPPRSPRQLERADSPHSRAHTHARRARIHAHTGARAHIHAVRSSLSLG